MTVDPITLIVGIIVPIIVAVIEYRRWRRNPQAQSADAAESLSIAAAKLAESYKSLYEDERAKRVLLEQRIEQVEKERGEAIEEIENLSKKLNRHLEDYSQMAIDLQIAQKRIREFENRE